jgi:hypothetical protein
MLYPPRQFDCYCDVTVLLAWQRGRLRKEEAEREAEAFRLQCQASIVMEESSKVPVRFPLLPRSRIRNELDNALYLTPWYKESERLGLGGRDSDESDDSDIDSRATALLAPEKTPATATPRTHVSLTGVGVASTSRHALA